MQPRSHDETQEERLSRVLEIVQKLETSQGEVLNQIGAVSEEQSRTEANVLLLEKRVLLLERAAAEPSPVPLAPNDALEAQISSMCDELSVLRSTCVHSEARSRRDNVLFFFGVPDLDGQTWTESENHVLRLWTNLETPVVALSIV